MVLMFALMNAIYFYDMQEIVTIFYPSAHLEGYKCSMRLTIWYLTEY